MNQGWVGCLLVLALTVSVAAREASAAKPIADYLRTANYQEAKISPSGERLALTQKKGKQEALIVLDIAKGEVLSATHFGNDENISNFLWATEDRLLIQPGVHFAGYYDAKTPTGELIGLNYDGSGHRVLFGYRAGRGEITTGTRAKRKKSEFAGARVIDLLPGEPRKVIIQKTYFGTSSPNPEAVKIDISTGNTKRLASSPLSSGRFVTDGQSNVSLFYGRNSADDLVAFYRPGGRGDFKQISSADAANGDITPFLPDGKAAFWSMGYGEGDKQALYRWRPAKNDYEEIYRHPGVDVEGTLTDFDNELYAIFFDDHFPDYYYPDPKHPLARAHVGVRKAFPGTDAYFVSFSADNRKAVLRVSSPQMPAEFKLVDLATNSLTPLVKTRPWLTGADLSPMEPFAIKARDGVELRGFTTLPSSVTAEQKAARPQLPFVVLVHGGPHGVADTWGFNPEVQLLASRGYGVMSVNFRGSGGRGWEFESSGYRHWGTTMQDDVTDATRWLIQKGLADKDRICIMGGSYGGYAALNGVVREPDMYQCAIGLVGVYDLTLMLRDGDIPEFTSGPAYLDKVLGKDHAILAARSPVYNASKIKAAVLLAHGEKDERVPIEHARRMRDALKKAGNPAEWLLERREGHGFFNEENQVAFYERVFEFLGKHVGPGAVQ